MRKFLKKFRDILGYYWETFTYIYDRNEKFGNHEDKNVREIWK